MTSTIHHFIWGGILLLGFSPRVFTQNVGLGTTTPHASAAFDISATDRGLLPPRMSTLQRNAIASPATGLLVYDTDLKQGMQWNGIAWKATQDNLGNHTATQSLQLGTNWLSGDGDAEGIRVQPDGLVRIGDGAGTAYSAVSLGTPAANTAKSRIAVYEDPVGTGGSRYFYGMGFLQDSANANHYGTGIWGGTNNATPGNGQSGTATPSVFVDNAENVGIGTLNPSAKLHVNGGVRIEAGSQFFQVNQPGTVTSTHALSFSTLSAPTYSGLTGIIMNTPDTWVDVQTFTVPYNCTVSSIKIKVQSNGTTTLRGGIKHIASGTMFLNTYDPCFGCMQTFSLTTYTIPFNANLIAGETYSIVLNALDDHAAQNYPTFIKLSQPTNPFADGESSVDPDSDILFELNATWNQTLTQNIPVLFAESGCLGIGKIPNQNYRADVEGIIRCNSIVQTSDFRYKQNIQPIQKALDKILSIRGVQYNWRRDEYPLKAFDSREQVGFIAQELEKVIPQAVSKDSDGFYAVDYQKVIPVLVEALKEQQADIEALKNLQHRTEADYNVLKAQVESLTKVVLQYSQK